MGGSGPYEGHIFVNGLPVCDDGHNNQNALVVCRFVKTHSFLTQVDHSFDWEFLKQLFRMLGYSSGGATVQSWFGPVADTFGMDNVQCIGNETSILDCPHVTVDDCGPFEGAGVICTNLGMF